MKSIRIEDDIHTRLTALVGELTAESGRMQTYADAIAKMLDTSVVLPEDLIKKIKDLIKERKLIGYKNHLEFVRDAVRDRLEEVLEEEFYVKVPIPREEYDILEKILDETAAPYKDPSDYIRKNISEVVERYKSERKEKE